MHRRRTAIVRALFCLGLSTTGCGKAEDAAEQAAAAADKAKDGAEAAVEATVEGAVEGADAVVDAAKDAVGDGGGLGAAVAEIAGEQPSYPMALDPLLDLLPADSPRFSVVRDVDDLLTLAEGGLQPLGAASGRLAGVLPADFATGMGRFEQAVAKLRSDAFDIEKGLVLGDIDGKSVIIFAAKKPEAWPELMRELGADEDDIMDACRPLADDPTYSVCAKQEETIATYKPSNGASAFRARLATALTSEQIERSNFVGVFGREGEKGTAGITTTGGGVHVAFTIPAPDEMREFLGGGPSPGLGMLVPGGGMQWTYIDPEVIKRRADEAPIIMRTALKALTGEFVIGSVADPWGVVMLAGVDDPAVVGGLVALVGTQVGSVPETLPDGTPIAATVENLTIGGKSVQAVRVALTLSKPQLAMFSRFGLAPEAWLVSVGGYAGVIAGADKRGVEKLAEYRGEGLSAAGKAALPSALVDGLARNRVAVAMHMPLDGLHSPQMRSVFDMAIEQIPASERSTEPTPEQALQLGLAAMASWSSMAVWFEPPTGDAMQVHIMIERLADPSTAEGKAAHDAIMSIASGSKEATEVYKDLAARYPSSARLGSYQSRAGIDSEGALSSVFLMGAAAAVALPAMATYVKRSESAAEAEAAAAEAAAAAAAEAARVAAEGEAGNK